MFQSPLCMVHKYQSLNCLLAAHHCQVSWRVKLTIFEVQWQELQIWSLKKNLAFETHPSTETKMKEKKKRNVFKAILGSITFNKFILTLHSWISCFNYKKYTILKEGKVIFWYCSHTLCTTYKLIMTWSDVRLEVQEKCPIFRLSLYGVSLSTCLASGNLLNIRRATTAIY